MVDLVLNVSDTNLIFCKQVLYRFLEYYSQLDWDKYCLTIHGPVELSSLAEGNSKYDLMVFRSH